MLSVQDLNNAQPKLWRDAADDALAASKHCHDVDPSLATTLPAP
jgi:hypothetical protein